MRYRVLAFVEAYVLTGPAKNIIEFARRAGSAAEGARIELATFERAGLARNEFVEAATAAGVPVHVIAERGRFDASVLASMRRLTDRTAPDIVQTHSVKSHFLMAVSGLWRRTPWIAFHHGYTAQDAKMRAYNSLDRFSLRRARRLVTVCEPFAAQLRARGVPDRKIAVVHNGVRPFAPPDEAAVRALREQFGVPDDASVVIAIGRLSAEKGHADLVEAASRLRGIAPELRFRVLIAGEGVARPELERRIAESGLEGVVVLCGHRSDVRPFFAIASAMALPSYSEGSPNAMLEAHAAGVPVAATRVGGVPEVATDEETALLVPPGDPERMARALARLLQEPGLAERLAAAARERVLARFTPEAQMRSILDVYARTIAEPA